MSRKNYYKVPTSYPREVDVPIVISGIYDGTKTNLSISLGLRDGKGESGRLGVGYSRRRKGDRRNDLLGVDLALIRALEDAAHSIKVRLASTGYAGYTDLPQEEVDKIMYDIQKQQQANWRGMEEFLALMSGGHTPADIGITEEEMKDDG